MAGVSKGQFSNDDFIYVSRWSFVIRRFERRFCFKRKIPLEPNTKRSTDFFKVEKTFDLFLRKSFCPTRAEQVFVNTSERNVRVCIYMCI